MLHLDDVQLYDLPGAGPLLFKDPARLAREARIRSIPSAQTPGGLGLPAPWVEAEAGVSDSDPVSLCRYWLGRLSPPSREGHRPLRARERLEADDLLDADEAARRLCATPPALERLDHDGSVPSLRVDGQVRYDAQLVELISADEDRAAIAARRETVRTWARFEYGAVPPARTGVPAPAPAAPPGTPTPPEAPDAPKAYEIPRDLGLDELPPPSTLLDVDGFDTVDD